MKKISILCLLLCCTTVKAVDSVNSTLSQKFEMMIKKGGWYADIVRRIEKEFPEKFQKIKSNSDSFRFLVEQEDVVGFTSLLMGKKEQTTEIDKDTLGNFADLLLEPQFRDNIDNILTLEKKKKKNKDSLIWLDYPSIVRKIGDTVIVTGSVDCLTDETLPAALHSSDARCLWGCLDNLGRQILYTGYENDRIWRSGGDDAYGTSFDEFIKTWDAGLKKKGKPFENGPINPREPEHRKIVNDYFHENFFYRED